MFVESVRRSSWLSLGPGVSGVKTDELSRVQRRQPYLKGPARKMFRSLYFRAHWVPHAEDFNYITLFNPYHNNVGSD